MGSFNKVAAPTRVHHSNGLPGSAESPFHCLNIWSILVAKYTFMSVNVFILSKGNKATVCLNTHVHQKYVIHHVMIILVCIFIFPTKYMQLTLGNIKECFRRIFSIFFFYSGLLLFYNCSLNF